MGQSRRVTELEEARAELGAGRLDRAIDLLKGLATADGPVEAHGLLGEALIEKGLADDGLGHLRRACELSPDDVRARIALGRALERIGRRDQALDTLRAVLAAHPASLDAAVCLARIHGRERPRVPAHRTEAIAVLDQALARAGAPRGEAASHVAQAWFLQGSLLDDTSEGYSDAIRAYERGLELDPSSAVAHNNLGALHLQRREWDAALSHLERALALAPDLRSAHQNLAKLIYHRLSMEQGQALFSRISQSGGHDGGRGLFGVAHAIVDLASLEAYEDLYSKGHQVKNRVGMGASRLKRLARSVRQETLRGDELATRLDEAVADQEELYGLLVELLRVVRPEQLNLVAMDVAPSLTRLVAQLRTSFKGRVRIRLSLQRNLPSVLVDRTRMSEAITNLVKNAVEAISERYGEEAGERGRIDLAAFVTPDSRQVVLAVSDNGSGIPAASLQEVCRAGFTTKPGGSGLGLAITRRIVADHGGVLGVDSRPGDGARFTIRLPLETEARLPTGGLWTGPVVYEPDALLVDELA